MEPYNKCRIPNCQNKETHITLGHKCNQCSRRGHSLDECGDDQKIYILKYMSAYDRVKANEFCSIYGCAYFWLHRADAHVCDVCSSTTHSTAYCDYSPFNIPVVDIPPVNILVIDMKRIISIKCPLCLKKNNINMDTHIIYGLEDKCKACLTNNVNIYLPECKHAILCKSCVINIHDCSI